MVQSLSAQPRESNFAGPTGFASITSGGGLQQRRAMAKAITLLESTRADHRQQADELLTALLPHTGQSFRLGISGVPAWANQPLSKPLACT
jgi:hypothetical protein